MDEEKFTSRDEAIDFGKDYEYLMAAYYALTLSLNDEVAEFKLSTNNKDMGDFDDVVIEIELKNGEEHVFALQLKHVNRTIALITLTTDNKKFSLKKYSKEFQKIKSTYEKTQAYNAPFENFHFILYTNSLLEKCEEISEEGRRLETIIGQTKEESDITIQKHENCCGNNLLNLCDVDGFVYKFETNKKDSPNEAFFKQFSFYTNQKTAKEVQTLIAETLFKTFKNCSSEVVMHFLNYFNYWCRRDYGAYKLTKQDIKLKLAELFLTMHIPEPDLKNLETFSTEKTNTICNIFYTFDIILVKEASDLLMNKIWGIMLNNYFPIHTIKEWSKPIPQLNAKLLESNKFEIPIAARNENFSELSLKNLYVLLWYKDLLPVIVKENSTDQDLALALELTRNKEKKKYMIQNEDLLINKSDWTIFTDLSNLIEHQDIYHDIEQLTFSLQGRPNISLQDLISIDNRFLKIITFKEIILMLDGKYIIGDDCRIKFPKHCVKRLIPKLLLKSIAIGQLQNDLFVVSYQDEIEDIRNHFKVNVVEIDRYLLLKQNRSIKSYVPKLFSSLNQDTSSKFVIAVKSECTREQFEEICSINEDQNCHYVKINGERLEWIQSKGSVQDLRQYQESLKDFKEEDFVEDLQVFNYFTNKINIICADPGMGKTAMMHVVKYQCPFNHWVVLVNVNDHVDFFMRKRDTHEILDYFSKIEANDSFLEDVSNIFFSNQKVIFMWDGLDELPEEGLGSVISAIKTLSHCNYLQWVSARTSLKEFLEDTFNVLSTTLTRFNVQDQYNYVYDHLKEKYNNEEQIQSTIEKMDENISNSLSCGYLDYAGVPLHIHMMMEIFMNQEREDNNLQFVTLTDIYQKFIQGKCNCLFQKADADLNNYHMQQIQEQFINTQLPLYEIAALKATLDEDAFNTLNLNCDELIQDLLETEDPLGLIVAINRHKKPIFVHKTYEEFLIASWLAKNHQNDSGLTAMFFQEKYINIRLMFDMLLAKNNPVHLAVLYQKLNVLKEYEDEISTTKDGGGRSALHIACAWGRKHPRIKISEEGLERSFVRRSSEENRLTYRDTLELLLMHQKAFSSIQDELTSERAYEVANKMFQKSYQEVAELPAPRNESDKIVIFMEDNTRVVEEDDNCLAILKFLLDNDSSPLENDKILSWNCFQYADQTLSLAAIDLMLNYQKTNIQTLKSYKHVPTLVHYGICFSYKNLLDIVDDIPLIEYRFDFGNSTLLQLAVETNNLYGVSKLLQSKCYLKVINKEKDGPFPGNPLSSSTFYGNVDMMNLLLDTGAKVNGFKSPPLYCAALMGRINFCRRFLEAGADVQEINYDGNSPLIAAAMIGDVDITKLLLEHGASVNHISNDFTALEHSVCIKNLQMVKLILKYNPNIDHQSEELGYTALHYASEIGNVEILKCLLENGANTRIKTRAGFTPLQLAIVSQNKEVALELLRADPSVADGCTSDSEESTETPIILATMNNDADFIKILAEMGVDVHSSKHHTTPLNIAAAKGFESSVVALIKAGASVNYVDSKDVVPLFAAISNVTVLKILLDHGADVNFKDKVGISALHLAASYGELDSVKELIERKADINAKDKENNTPLHHSIQSKQLTIVKYLLNQNASIDNGGKLLCQAAKSNFPECIPILLEQGIEVNALDESNNSALFYAGLYKNSCAEILLTKGANPNLYGSLGQLSVRPLQFALFYGQTKLMKDLHAAGAELTNIVDSTSALHIAACLSDVFSVLFLTSVGADVNVTDVEGKTPLHYVSGSLLSSQLKTLVSLGNAAITVVNDNDEDCAKELILQGANVNYQDNYLATPLHLACYRKRTQMIKLLIQHGADINLLNDSNQSPLHVCFEYGSFDDAVLLVQNGARLDQEDKHGNIPTVYAVDRILKNNLPDLAVLIKLQEFGADFERPDKDGFTLLHKASSEGKIEIVKFLLDTGANVDVINNEGCTPIFYACNGNFNDIVKLILERSCSVNVQNKDGDMPLHFATYKGSIDVIKLLLDSGSSVNLQNKKGFIPLHYAVSTDVAYEACNMLIKSGAIINTTNIEGNSPLHIAITSNQKEILKLFIEKGAVIDQKCLHDAIFTNDFNTFKLLHESCKHYTFNFDDLLHVFLCNKYSTNVDLLQYLLQNGANPNSTMSIGDEHYNIAAIHEACAIGFYDFVKCLLENGAVVNTGGLKGRTPLMEAVIASRNLNIATLLVDSGADINKRDDDGCTALFHACKQGNLDMVTFLHENGADLSLQNNEGSTALIEALSYASVVKYLIAKGSNVNHQDKNKATPLYHASLQGNYDTALYLLENGADVNVIVEPNNFTPLQAAVIGTESGRPEIVQILLSCNADITIRSKSGNTVVTNAVSKDKMDIMKLFIKHLRDPQRINFHGVVKEDYFDYLEQEWEACFFKAATHNVVETLTLFLQEGLVTVNYEEKISHYTLLHYACNYGSYDAAVYLIENGADVNAQNVDGLTPLYLGTMEGHLDIIKLLVQHKAEVDVVNNHGNTSLFCAAARGNLEIIEFLHGKGAKIDVIDEDGDLPLHDAAAFGHLSVVQFLISKKADYKHKNKNGKTPLDLATDNGKSEVVEFLLSVCSSS